MSAPKATAEIQDLVLEYDLHDLPTAQHKAGLAGLLLFIENLRARGKAPLPEVEEVTPHSARIRLTRETLTLVLDDLYDAEWVEVTRNKPYEENPKRIEEVEVETNGKRTLETRYIYDECRPRGNALVFWLESGVNSPWLKLWQDMLWSVLRAQRATRREYERRANGESVKFTAGLWKRLCEAERKRADGKLVTEEIAGSLFIGAQAVSAESVPFKGRAEETLLLHFWQLAAPIYVPQAVDLKKGERTYQGFLLVVPEVGNLEHFIQDIKVFWQRLDPALAGYRPRDALIDLPEEGGLEFLYHLARHRLERGEIGSDVWSVELYHMERQGNSVRLLAAESVRPNRRVLTEYERLRGLHGNPFFKALRIRNLLADQAWHAGAQTAFAAHPWQYFIRTTDTPRFRFFGIDVRRRMRALEDELKRKEAAAMSEHDEQTFDHALARRVYRVIGDYVRYRIEDRTGQAVATLPKDDDGHTIYSREYREACEKVTSDAFLAMRGRHGADFVAYFTGSICAVPHYLNEGEFLTVSHALIEQPDTVKNLAMLALSAHSWVPGRETDPESTDAGQEEDA